MKAPTAARRFSRSASAFAAVLVLAGMLLGLTTVPAAFTIDDANHVAAVVGLGGEHFGMPGTAKLPASPELLWFDPSPRARPQVTTPVVSTIPPLYAILAWPFSLAGVTGLQWLNVLGVCWATWLVYALAARHGKQPITAWVAAALFLLGSYVIEYAQGIWAHGLSLGLCASAFYAAARLREQGSLRWAVVAGTTAGLAIGVRYQNAALAGLIGLGVALLGSNRARVSLAYLAGMTIPLATSSILNHARFAFWNPISKGAGYLDASPGSRGWSVIPEAFHATWARLVDASTHPPFGSSLHDLNVVMPKDPDTGAFFVLGVVRKAMLQSSPWLALGLVALVMAWLPDKSAPAAQRREARAASFVVVGMLVVFGYFGFRRSEGWAFNQRYMLDVMPLVAVATAWALERLGNHKAPLAAGVLGGALVAAAALWGPAPETALRSMLLLTLPVLMGGLILALSLARALDRMWPRLARVAATSITLVTAAGLGWAATIHLAEDVGASRKQRLVNAATARRVEEVLPDAPVALFVHWGSRDPFTATPLSRDIVVADTWADNGRDAPMLADALQRQGREVFVWLYMPRPILERLVADRAATMLLYGNRPLLLRLGPKRSSGPDTPPIP